MKDKSRLLITLALLFSLWHVGAANAGTPDDYPDTFAQWGVITGIDVARGHLRFGDVTVKVSPDLRVHTPHTQHETIHGLRPGMRVAMGPGGGRTPGAVTRIWVLPEGYQPRRTRH